MITPSLYKTLDPSERRLWHSHVYEVKSGMLIMPNPQPAMPSAAWEAAENREMEQVVQLYGKVFHLWQTDRGDKLPLGEPKLMTSYTEDGQMKDWDEAVGDRDRRFGEDWRRKKEIREGIEGMEVHPGKCLGCGRWEQCANRSQMRIKRGRSRIDYLFCSAFENCHHCMTQPIGSCEYSIKIVNFSDTGIPTRMT